eukprot:TRINITY_DN3602_c0_g1_i1.p1 TRINITY_DN3602_c0_g1~~TRINITY_DN3602_c0_g1_i1.p1  ORF type:complete len:313 (-),score=15.25 TRINITY_DN3602_c0_g1_i1:429-1367(-)
MSSRSVGYWCHACRVPIRLPVGDPLLCRLCGNGFIEEYGSLVPGASLVLSSSGRFVDNNDSVEFGPRNAELLASLMHHLANGTPIPREMHGGGRGPYLMFGHGFLGNEPGAALPVNFGDYFFGTNLDQFIEQLTQNDRCGPPPASRSAIDALPSIRVTSWHLNNESHCPVCQERFQIGGMVRELPCKHIFHHDCIVPWLNQHNSCPICRTSLHERSGSASSSSTNRVPVTVNQGGTNTSGSTNPATNNAFSRMPERNIRDNQGWRGFLSGMWPFSSSGQRAGGNRAQSNSRANHSHSDSGFSFGDGDGSWLN